ncbi:hypothetical protein GCM10009069_29390 [Algimonas arctica]|uniref:DUF2924 domain-containing protein n=1 Tax=Algimonas arctica TaxID=1479486 RepID=A0A8J3G3F2_9PROT|nr:DUF2924 domain-containing protein [Algimonas arctica]GHB04970.1 hypothetical protein GCM10009069_29390 [Algimonas arctica]
MSRRDKVHEGLAELEALNRAELGDRWTAVVNRPPPKSASRVFLLRALSYELQSKHAPGLSKVDLKVLQEALCDQGAGSAATKCSAEAAPKPSRSKPRIALVPGSRLVREWNGRSYTVSVIEEGFVYKDKVWSSLSAIAKDITGAHWSGPRFFGLNKASG